MTSQNATWFVYVLLCLSGAAGAVADWSLDRWQATRVPWWWVVVILGISADIALFVAVLSTARFSFGITVTMSLVTHSLVGLGFDRVFNGESYGPVTWAGIAFGLMGMALMDLGGSESETSAAAEPAVSARMEPSLKVSSPPMGQRRHAS